LLLARRLGGETAFLGRVVVLHEAVLGLAGLAEPRALEGDRAHLARLLVEALPVRLVDLRLAQRAVFGQGRDGGERDHHEGQ
jgi:hypothetical protein